MGTDVKETDKLEKSPQEMEKKSDKDLVAGELKPPEEEDEVETNMEMRHVGGDTRMVTLKSGEEEGTSKGPEEMKPLPEGETPTKVPNNEVKEIFDNAEREDMVNENVVDMATAVAIEMEEKRRNKEWERMQA